MQGALSFLHPLQCKLLEVATDGHGIVPEALEQVLKQNHGKVRIKVCLWVLGSVVAKMRWSLLLFCVVCCMIVVRDSTRSQQVRTRLAPHARQNGAKRSEIENNKQIDRQTVMDIQTDRHTVKEKNKRTSSVALRAPQN